jgi:hypothetical protein
MGTGGEAAKEDPEVGGGSRAEGSAAACSPPGDGPTIGEISVILLDLCTP